jgi:transposase
LFAPYAVCGAEASDLDRDGKVGVHLDGSKGVGVSRLEVIEGPSGRRRRTKADRARIAAESLASVADVAGRARHDALAGFRSCRRLVVPESMATLIVFAKLVVESAAGCSGLRMDARH